MSLPRPQHGDSTSPCAQWPPRSLWLWQSFCSDLIGPVRCIWHDRPQHFSRSFPKLLWYFWFCSQLVLVIPFRPSANHLRKQLSVWPSCPSVWSASRFSPWAHCVRSVHSTTFSDITKSLYGASTFCWWFYNNNNSQLHRSSQPPDVDQTVLSVQDCVSDIKDWMTDNKLQPNEDKTEAMLFNSSKLQDVPASLSICQTTVSTRIKISPWNSISISYAKQLSVNFVESALFDSTSQLMPQRLLLSPLYCPRLTIAILS